VFRALIVLFSYGNRIVSMQNNWGNFSNVAFLPCARFFARQRGRGVWPKWPNAKYASVQWEVSVIELTQ